MAPPAVSIIIPCYNQARFLPETVESVLKQTVSDWECLLINDGSTDETPAIAQRFATRDSRFRYFEHENRGLAATRNVGLDNAVGRYIQFLDADDIIKPQKLELQVSAIIGEARVAAAYCDYYRAYSQSLDTEVPQYYLNGRLDEGDPWLDLAANWESRVSVPAHAFLFDARLFSCHGIRFDASLPTHEDWDCWMRIFAHKPVLKFVDAKLAVYRLHETAMTGNRRAMRRGFLAAIKKQRRLCRDDSGKIVALSQLEREARHRYRRFPSLAIRDRLGRAKRRIFRVAAAAVQSRSRG